MYNGQIINRLIEKSGLRKTELLSQLDMQYKSLQTIIEGNPTVKSLEKIADFFKVPMDYFFDRKIEISDPALSITGNGNKVQHGDGNVMIETQAKEIEHLNQLLAEKEKAIADKERTIQILLNQNS